MSTVIELDEKQLREVCEATQQADAAIAIQTATVEYIRYWKRQRLKELAGKVEMDEGWRMMNVAELGEASRDQSSH